MFLKCRSMTLPCSQNTIHRKKTLGHWRETSFTITLPSLQPLMASDCALTIHHPLHLSQHCILVGLSCSLLWSPPLDPTSTCWNPTHLPRPSLKATCSSKLLPLPEFLFPSSILPKDFAPLSECLLHSALNQAYLCTAQLSHQHCYSLLTVSSYNPLTLEVPCRDSPLAPSKFKDAAEPPQRNRKVEGRISRINCGY